jgi:hypothetical protein
MPTNTEYSLAELFAFLDHAADRGLMATATAKALAVASRRVFAVLSDDEQHDLRVVDLDSVVKRFTNKNAKDFTPQSLRVYGQRATKAIDQFFTWRNDPAGFSVKTRSTVASRRRTSPADPASLMQPAGAPATVAGAYGGFESSVPIRQGRVVTISNLPADLTKAEADRLAEFIKMLAVAD